MHNPSVQKEMREIYERLKWEFASVCRRCENPPVPHDQMNFDEPDMCLCHCDKTDGLRRAFAAMRKDLELDETV